VRNQVVAVEPNDATSRLDDRQAAAPAPPRCAGRFLYAGGAQPLAGYTIKRGVGQGGFGEIYYALSDAGKEVALKLIRRNLDVELRGIRQCLNLKHPNLLSLHDIRQDQQGDTWVVMEYVADECLEDVLAARPDGLPPAEALAWIHGVGAGVAYLHDRGIVHRDLKPGNIFRDEGVVKVGDYGLSKFISCSRRSGQTESIGTVHYMAPEVANGRYGKELDVYAMGVMLYEMLTGRVPFDGESVGEVLMKHLTARPDVSMLPEPYRGIVARALEKDPALRYRSAAEMLAALPPCETLSYLNSRGLTAPGESGSPLAETPIVAKAVDEEPILRALRDAWRQLQHGWHEANLNTPIKILLLLVGLFLVVANAGLLVPLAVGLCILYGGYRLVRMLVAAGGASTHDGATDNSRGLTAPGTVASAASQSPAVHTVQPGHGRQAWGRMHEKPALALVVKSPRERLADLLGSLLAGSLVAVAMCVVMVLLESYHNATPRPEQFAWLLLSSMAGVWAVLIPSKFWEGTRGEPALRRFILMVVGLGVGGLAFLTAATLMVALPPTAGYPLGPDYKLPPSFYDALDGRPLVMAYAACFGTLFLLMRWWRQANPLRSTRLSLWSLILSMAVAGAVAAAWQFPQPWLPMVAGTISVSVQLASPWVHPGKRGRRGGG